MQNSRFTAPRGHRPIAAALLVFSSIVILADTMAGVELPEKQPAFSTTFCILSDTTGTAVYKSPGGALLRSLIFPGWGQWYNEKKFKALLVFGTEAGIAINSAIQNQYLQRSTYELEQDYYRNNRNLSNWILVVAVLVSMLDAYVDAHLYHFDESPEVGYSRAITTLTKERGDMACKIASLEVAW